MSAQAKIHYDTFLANHYAWISGDLQTRIRDAEEVFRLFEIRKTDFPTAIDLGCGHGIQSIALANCGIAVTAVDFNRQLLEALILNKGDLAIHTVESDLVRFLDDTARVNVITCMGDTITHLAEDQLNELVRKSFEKLIGGGRLIISFRDLTEELTGTNRFIPVRSDANRIFTCFLEYFDDHVMVHDIFHERKGDGWQQSVSGYPKLRLSPDRLANVMTAAGFRIIRREKRNGMDYVAGERPIP